MTGPVTTTVDPAAEQTPAERHRPNTLAAVWRVHRVLVLGSMVLGGVLIVLLVVLRLRAEALSDRVLSTAVECRGDAVGSLLCGAVVDDAVHADFRVLAGLLALACTGLGALSGALAGAPVFGRDFEQRTLVWGLTQSIGRTRWWAAKVLVVLVPVTLLMLAVGAVSSWSLDHFAWADRPMGTEFFLSRSYIPAAITVLAMSLGLSAGILWRSTVAAVLTAVLCTVGIVAGGEVLRPHLVTLDRHEVPAGSYSSPGFPQDAWFVDSGYLNASGEAVLWTGTCTEWDSVPIDAVLTDAENHTLLAQCMARDGIVTQYSDVVPSTRFGLLRAAWTGLALLLSGLVIAGGFLRVRRRVL